MPISTTVLVIDDDAAIRETLRLLLEDAGYAVIEAAGVDRALAILRGSPRGLVVLVDYRMPRLDGETLLALAERERWLVDRRHAFICLTASPQSLPGTLSSLLARYDVPVVGKPFELDDLLAVIKQAEQRLTLLPVPIRRRDQPPDQGQ